MGQESTGQSTLALPESCAGFLSLTVVILTRDEAHHIARAIASVAPVAQRILVVDSGSEDGTQDIARSLGAEVFERPWLNYADQFQWALDNCAIATDWTMRLDADEWIGADLAARLGERLPHLAAETAGISLDRRHHFLGRWIRHGGRFPLRLLRIWRTGTAHIERRWMDEHMVLDSGTIAHVDGEFVDENLGSIAYFTDKHNRYATREAIDALLQRYSLDPGQSLASTAQARRKRSGKTRFYNRLPLGVGPVLYFLYRYLFQLGFLDGRAGLIYHVLQGFWYRFLVDARRFELARALADCTSDAERIERLGQLTGHDVASFRDRRDGA